MKRENMKICFPHFVKKEMILLSLILIVILMCNALFIYPSNLTTSFRSPNEIISYKQKYKPAPISPSLLWKYQTEGTVTPSPAIADVNEDGELEVIFGSGDSKLYVVNGINGSLIWYFQTNGVIDSTPALGDLDGDNKLEILINHQHLDNSYLYALNGEDRSIL